MPATKVCILTMAAGSGRPVSTIVRLDFASEIAIQGQIHRHPDVVMYGDVEAFIIIVDDCGREGRG